MLVEKREKAGQGINRYADFIEARLLIVEEKIRIRDQIYFGQSLEKATSRNNIAQYFRPFSVFKESGVEANPTLIQSVDSNAGLRRFGLGKGCHHEAQLISHIPNAENNRRSGEGLGSTFRHELSQHL